jgi:hypothetical protein
LTNTFVKRENITLIPLDGADMQTHFPILIMIARPAAGKSEIIKTLRKISPEVRLERFHIGSIEVFDDFPMLWIWFEEDDLLEKVFKRARLHTTPDGFFLHADLWHLLIRRLNLEYYKWRRDAGDDGTAASPMKKWSVFTNTTTGNKYRRMMTNT